MLPYVNHFSVLQNKEALIIFLYGSVICHWSEIGDYACLVQRYPALSLRDMDLKILASVEPSLTRIGR